ncbi:IQ domain-containing protein C [Seriola dumerili]|uniref:IQ domain-containing protein C n=1 Tax=Seriola dumerili TaxID=41447 RepID=UPI000BBE15BA|nr:IQ domain-containing protein C [Seriola dumerili]
MDRGKWEKILTHFQACARGHLVRNEVRRARKDFEDIVKEIDGGLTHLQWRDSVIPIPHFTDTDGPFLRPSSAASKTSDPGLDVSASPQSPAAAAALRQERGGDHDLFPQKIAAERDDSETKGQDRHPRDCFPSSHTGGDGVGQRQRGVRDQEGDKDGGIMESTGDSTTVWSSLELDVNYSHSHQGPRQYCLAKEVPHTPEALRLHRNTLTMELVWLQQAIDSRKKYLSLKDRLTIS